MLQFAPDSVRPMQTQKEFHNLLVNLLADLEQISVLWQVAALAACLALAWWLTRLIRPRIGEAEGAWKISAGGAQRDIFPLTALLLVVIAKAVLKQWQSVHLLNVAIPLLLALAIIQVAVYMLRSVFATSGRLANWERFISWTIWIILAFYLSGFLSEIIEILDSLSLRVGKQRISLLLVLEGLASVAITVLLALWLGSWLEARLMRAELMDLNLRVVLSKIVRAALIVVGVMIVLPLVGIDITVLSVFSGALGVGLGFGLQKIASSYVSGFIILLDRSIRIGDTVTVDNRNGSVTQMTTRYTVLKSGDGTEAIIPNDTLITSTVVNHSFSDRKVRLTVPVQVGYGSPLETAMQVMLEAAKRQPRVLSDPAPKVFIKGFGDNGINLELGIWVGDPEEGHLELRSEINLEIWREFKKQGVEIPFPQREVRVLKESASGYP